MPMMTIISMMQEAIYKDLVLKMIQSDLHLKKGDTSTMLKINDESN